MSSGSTCCPSADAQQGPRVAGDDLVDEAVVVQHRHPDGHVELRSLLPNSRSSTSAPPWPWSGTRRLGSAVGAASGADAVRCRGPGPPRSPARSRCGGRGSRRPGRGSARRPPRARTGPRPRPAPTSCGPRCGRWWSGGTPASRAFRSPRPKASSSLVAGKTRLTPPGRPYPTFPAPFATLVPLYAPPPARSLREKCAPWVRSDDSGHPLRGHWSRPPDLG